MEDFKEELIILWSIFKKYLVLSLFPIVFLLAVLAGSFIFGP